MIKCVVFDVGGVLTTSKIDPLYDMLNEKLDKRVFHWNMKFRNAFICGRISSNEFFKHLSEKTGYSRKYLSDLYSAEVREFIKINKDVLVIAKDLRKKGYRTAIISNAWPIEKGEDKKIGLYKNFDPVIVSCNVGCMKPSKKIFRILFSAAKLVPKECIYIEDRPKYIATPKSLGINTILYQNPLQLKKDLNKLGVKI